MASEDDRTCASDVNTGAKKYKKTPSQVEALESFYAVENYPSKCVRENIAKDLGLSSKQVTIWFWNRRRTKRRRQSNAIIVDNKSEEPGNQLGSTSKTVNTPNFAAEVLAAERTDKELLGVENVENIQIMERSFYCNENEPEYGIPMGEKESSPWDSGDPAGNDEMETSSWDGGDTMDDNETDCDDRTDSEHEHEAISAVKANLGSEFREDGPPLNVYFDPLPRNSIF